MLAELRASFVRHRLPISVALVVLAIIGGHWAIFGRSVSITLLDDPPADSLVSGTLQINHLSMATARLHNVSGWTIDHVFLSVISGPKKKCRKGDADCGADGYLPFRNLEDADDLGFFRCGRQLAAEPASTFTCSFIATFKHGSAYGFSWSISEFSARRKDPLGIY